jgi:hypothetical protein
MNSKEVLQSLYATDLAQPRWYEKFKQVNITLGLAASVLLAIHWSIETFATSEISGSLPNFILKELGMAGFIALLLNISIEYINRRREAIQQHELLSELEKKRLETSTQLLGDLEKKHAETSAKLVADVNEQLFKTVYQRNVDPAVFKQVEKHLLRSDIMRREFSVSFKLKRFLDPTTSEPTMFVELTYCNDYRVINLTDNPVTVAVAKATVDVTPVYKDHCKFTRVDLGGEIIEGDKLDALVAKDGNFMSLVINRSVPPNDTFPVRVEYRKLAPLDYSEIICTTVPMDNLSLEVNTPDELFTVSALSLHPEDGVLKYSEKHQSKWKIEQPILPGQGIVMMWHLTDKSV